MDIPKEQGKFRTLQIPCIRDRVVQGALKLIFEADFCPNSYGFRPQRSPHRALAEVRRSLMRRMTTVIDVDLAKYFDHVRHDVLLGKIARRVQDPKVLHLVKLILKVGGKKGAPAALGAEMNNIFDIFGPALIASFSSAICYLVARRDFPPRDAVLVVIGVLIVGPVLAQVVGAWTGVSAGWLGLFFGFAPIWTIDQVAGKRSYGK